MELSELAAYAEEKYHIREQYKWPEFPGISVLIEPQTGKQIALLIYEWDPERGSSIQRLDIRCGDTDLSAFHDALLTRPFLKRGHEWVGLIINRKTDRDTVFRLLDQAAAACKKWDFSISLKELPRNGTDSEKGAAFYHGTAIPPRPDKSADSSPNRDRVNVPGRQAKPKTAQKKLFPDVPLTRWPAPEERPSREDASFSVPGKILKMRQLYTYGNYSFTQKCRNFCRQGKFMEDYEDHVPWNGYFKRYFPTYHDLNIPQLRGYFTWRTEVRNGRFLPVSISLAYIYLYELLNGIGTSSPEDALNKMKKFETGFLDSGIGDGSMRKNLHRWMPEYAILHGMDAAAVQACVDPELLRQDHALAVLRHPDSCSDEEVFAALGVFAGKHFGSSSVIKKYPERGRSLFAAIWRSARRKYEEIHDRDLFTACFGKLMSYTWHPLGNAVYLEELPHPDADFTLDECRIFQCRNGMWMETRYDRLYFHIDLFQSFLRAADRLLRAYLKTGFYLREREEEVWAVPLINPVIESDRQKAEEAAKPKITIDFSSLGKIRADAAVTRDSLLTEEEIDMETAASEKAGADSADFDTAESLPGLDPVHTRILRKIFLGESVAEDITANHLMPSIVADTINEALFDEIGDNVLECTDDRLTLVEDYREEIAALLKESSHQPV